jgi:ABC-2 type transport system ATP-binding protein
MTLSGGMKRRVMIAKALSHEPRVLFLDEPTAGVDVELRKGMWEQVRKLRENGVTIILTTHYIEEAEEMADRIGIINNGELILTEKKEVLLKNLGTKNLVLELTSEPDDSAAICNEQDVKVEGAIVTYTYDDKSSDTGVANVLRIIQDDKLQIKDINTKQSSLEEIFVSLVEKK